MSPGAPGIIEPHIHMFSRTTDDYEAMYAAGIRVAVEPSFWLGAARRSAGSFFDFYRLILDFEAERARRFGIDHYACVSVNPKEADDLVLAEEVLAGLGPYLEHPRCVAVGEIGFNRLTANEERIFRAQLELARGHDLPVLVHTPHDTAEVSKRAGVARILAILDEMALPPGRIVVDHNTENTMDLVKATPYWAGMTVYPYSKLNPERVIALLRRWGLERTLVNSSADWGASDPTSLAKVAGHMAAAGFEVAAVRRLVHDNPLAFYSQTPRFQPRFDLPFIHPSQYQR